jgi:glycerol-3-phosphate acyltransferase PlsY
MVANLALVLGAYLLGSIPHLSLLARFRRVDLDGDFHQSLWSRGGRLLAVVGIAGEVIKGLLPIIVGSRLGFELPVLALAGLAVVSGQMWPVFARFDGEKGNSVAFPMALALTLQTTLIAMIPALLALIARTLPRLLRSSSRKQPVFGGAYSRVLPLGVAISLFILPLLSWYMGKPLEIILGYSVLFVLIMTRRITAGLRADLRGSTNLAAVILNRFLYDRATTEWRKEGAIER